MIVQQQADRHHITSTRRTSPAPAPRWRPRSRASCPRSPRRPRHRTPTTPAASPGRRSPVRRSSTPCPRPSWTSRSSSWPTSLALQDELSGIGSSDGRPPALLRGAPLRVRHGVPHRGCLHERGRRLGRGRAGGIGDTVLPRRVIGAARWARRAVRCCPTSWASSRPRPRSGAWPPGPCRHRSRTTARRCCSSSPPGPRRPSPRRRPPSPDAVGLVKDDVTQAALHAAASHSSVSVEPALRRVAAERGRHPRAVHSSEVQRAERIGERAAGGAGSRAGQPDQRLTVSTPPPRHRGGPRARRTRIPGRQRCLGSCRLAHGYARTARHPAAAAFGRLRVLRPPLRVRRDLRRGLRRHRRGAGRGGGRRRRPSPSSMRCPARRSWPSARWSCCAPTSRVDVTVAPGPVVPRPGLGRARDRPGGRRACVWWTPRPFGDVRSEPGPLLVAQCWSRLVLSDVKLARSTMRRRSRRDRCSCTTSGSRRDGASRSTGGTSTGRSSPTT